jgi:hypothetical protein
MHNDFDLVIPPILTFGHKKSLGDCLAVGRLGSQYVGWQMSGRRCFAPLDSAIAKVSSQQSSHVLTVIISHR